MGVSHTILWLLLGFFSCCVSAGANWTVLLEPTDKPYGTSSRPSIRYGHEAVVYRDAMIVSHGYFYDRDTAKPSWLADTWKLQLTERQFTRLSQGIGTAEAMAVYSQNRIPDSPCSRYGHSIALQGDVLYLYGGHDGGYNRHGKDNYEPGYDFSEFYQLNLQSNKWKLLTSGVGPGKRYLHSSVIVDQRVIIYGGYGDKQGDVWAYDIIRSNWTQLLAEVSTFDGGPSRRVGHAAVPVSLTGKQGFIIFGGRKIENGTSTLMDDAWLFDLATNSWSILRPMSTPPSGRMYQAASLVPSNADTLVGVITGGTTTSPGISCNAETWLFILSCDFSYLNWTQLAELPIPVYDHTTVVYDNTAFAFGGHICITSKGKAPYSYLNSLWSLNLPVDLPQAACPVNQQTKKHETEL